MTDTAALPADLERMAREAGCFTPGRAPDHWAVNDEALARFAELVRADALRWQPIGTAPKDAEVMLWVDLAVGPPLVKQGCWYHDEGINEEGWIDTEGQILRVTHWMPLPAPPEAKT